MFIEMARLKIFSDAVAKGEESIECTSSFARAEQKYCSMARFEDYTEDEIASIIYNDVPPAFLELASRGISDDTWNGWGPDKRREYVRRHPHSKHATHHPREVAPQLTPHTHIRGEGVQALDVRNIEPEEKDIDRAHNLYFSKTGYNNGDYDKINNVNLSIGNRMSQAITDPVKLVRRLKAIINEAKRRKDNSVNTRAVIKAFVSRMRQLGFTEDQIDDVLVA